MEYELYHYGIPGMKWGVRRAKKQLARRTKRNIDDISDEEAKDFRRDLRRYHHNSNNYTRRRIILDQATSKHGKKYAKAIVNQHGINGLKRISAVLGATGTILAGKAVASAVINRVNKRKFGIIDLGDGTTVYMNPKGDGI